MTGPDLRSLPQHQLEAMHDAAARVLKCQARLTARNSSPVAEALKDAGKFEEWGHYPPGDVEDATTGSLFYYHAHAADERAEGEHGHFHIFVRPPRLGLSPEPDARYEGADPHAPEARIAHLVALSMDAHGRPMRLFATNRWVSDETWYPGKTVAGLVSRFAVGKAGPSAELNAWLTAMVCLFQPQIAGLLEERDRVLARAAGSRPLDAGTILEDRALQNLCETPIDLLVQIRAVEEALGIEGASAAA
ncbi:hypothetical protein [Afifella sp. IM 167]|uniref:DUF6969 family protein n=1 Tax=Afifella sp. IM 167 TaxID=2033586 RepID=UPI001CC8FCA6|nr:hypothetical protein [Afifella sp. IM 167]